MFEDSLMESSHRIQARSKYWSIATFFLNCGVLIALIVWPLLHPEALPRQMMAALVVAPPPPAPAPAPAMHSQPKLVSTGLIAVPSRISTLIKSVQAPEAAPSTQGVVEGLADSNQSASMNSVIGSIGTAPAIIVKPMPRPIKFSVSSGVMDGYLLEKTVPQYPAIARAARVQGTVVMQATISKAGLIENLRVISGSPMLEQAAIDAVRSWRYKPYLLNEEPVEVETTINVVFKLGD